MTSLRIGIFFGCLTRYVGPHGDMGLAEYAMVVLAAD